MSYVGPTVNNKIREKFLINDIFSLDQLLAGPADNLYKVLKGLWKKEFAENERIVFTHVGDIPQLAIDQLQRVISHVDITNCFVLLVTNDQSIDAKLKLAQTYWTHDDTNIETWFMNFDNIAGVQYDASKFLLPETLCINPWARLEIRPNGFTKPCCAYLTNLVDESDNVVSVTTHSIKEIYFGKELTNLREEFLRGGKPAKCITCWKNEDAGVVSIRQHSRWELNSEIYNIEWRSATQNNLKSIAMSLGNICNLKCRICNPENSSSIAAEQIRQIPLQQKKSSHLYALQKSKSWINQDLKVWDEFLELAPMLSEIRFAGGEPMMINKQFDLVKSLANSGESKHITLQYTTNGTIFPDHIIDHWKQYQKIDISISVDDIGPRLEYQRQGTVWKTLQENINWYQRLKCEMNIQVIVSINCTVSSMNVLYLPDICDWFDNIDIDFVRLNPLHYPSELSILTLPLAVKNHLVSMLSTAKFSEKFSDQVQSIINFIKLPDNSNNPGQFLKKIKQVDQLRNQKFSDSHPEMAKLMNYNS
jgi:MoaA/NifB/PqqE/SkfB family radical SAM enzyme